MDALVAADDELQDLRASAEAGDRTAMRRLAATYKAKGDLASAAAWCRHAADAGDDASMNSLAVILKDRGELEEAEAWYRRSAN